VQIAVFEEGSPEVPEAFDFLEDLWGQAVGEVDEVIDLENRASSSLHVAILIELQP